MLFSVAHGNTETGGPKHGEIVIRVAQRDDPFRGNSQFIAQEQQAGSFINSVRGTFQGTGFGIDSADLQGGKLRVGAGPFFGNCVVEIDFQNLLPA